MKIVAKQDEDVVMVLVTTNELGKIMGEDSAYWAKEKQNVAFQVGTEIHVSEIYRAIHELKSAKTTVLNLIEELADMAKAAKKLAGLKPFQEKEKVSKK